MAHLSQWPPVNAAIMFIQTSWTIKERVKVFEANISTSEYVKILFRKVREKHRYFCFQNFYRT